MSNPVDMRSVTRATCRAGICCWKIFPPKGPEAGGRGMAGRGVVLGNDLGIPLGMVRGIGMGLGGATCGRRPIHGARTTDLDTPRTTPAASPLKSLV